MGRVEDNIMIPDERRQAVRAALEELADRVESRDEPHCEYAYVFASDSGRLIVRQYENGRLHMQGSAKDLHREVVERLKELVEDAGEVSHSRLHAFPHGGSDEAGKGDVFGPLVVTVVYIADEDVRRLREAHVMDSKRLSDRRCQNLAANLKSWLPGRWVTSAIFPVQYNAMYSRLKRRGRNLNHLLARLHADCIVNLADRVNCESRPTVVVDKFASENLLLKEISDEQVEVIQLERAERDPAVAAASILARAEFLRGLCWMGKMLGCELPKGAGQNTIQVGRRLVECWGHRLLELVAKMHFSTVQDMRQD